MESSTDLWITTIYYDLSCQFKGWIEFLGSPEILWFQGAQKSHEPNLIRELYKNFQKFQLHINSIL